MRRVVVALAVLAVLAAGAPPAAAKGPWRITVRGPGIVGEVDLMEGPWDVSWIGFADTVVGRPGPARPGSTPPYVVTWYSAVGWDGPVLDRVAVHFDTAAVEVLELSTVFGTDRRGWFEARGRGLRELRRVIDEVVADRPVGALRYEFVVAAQRSEWAPVHGTPWAMRLLEALVGLAALKPW